MVGVNSMIFGVVSLNNFLKLRSLTLFIIFQNLSIHCFLQFFELGWERFRRFGGEFVNFS